MLSMKRVLALGGFTGVLATLAIAMPAQADGTKAVCITQGTAKTNPPIPLVGGKGSYTFATLSLICLVSEKVTNLSVVRFDLHSEGLYKNIVCGTGKLINTPATNVVTNQTNIVGTSKTDFAALAPKLKYDVEFVALQGLLFWHDPDVGKLPPGLIPKPLPDPKGSNSKPGAKPGGFVEFLPDSTKAFAPCTKAFQVLGVVYIDTAESIL